MTKEKPPPPPVIWWKYYGRWLATAIAPSYHLATWLLELGAFLVLMLTTFFPSIAKREVSMQIVNTSLGAIALWLFFAIVAIRLALAPYWIHRDQCAKAAKVEGDFAAYRTSTESHRRASYNAAYVRGLEGLFELQDLYSTGKDLYKRGWQEYGATETHWKSKFKQWRERCLRVIADRLDTLERDKFDKAFTTHAPSGGDLEDIKDAKAALGPLLDHLERAIEEYKARAPLRPDSA